MKTIKAREDLDEVSLRLCVQALQEAGILCYPTETFYAFGIDPWNEEAREKLYDLKGRGAEKQLPLIAADAEMIARFCCVEDPRFQILSQHFWPGPLTLVLPSRDGRTSYAVRVSSHPIARLLSKGFDAPIVSTSANLSGGEPVSDPSALPQVFCDKIEILIDGGICPGGLPSSIVSLLQEPPRILREGAIRSEEILSAL